MLRKVIAFGLALASSVLAADTGNVAVCYSPERHRVVDYDGKRLDIQGSIDTDFKTLSESFTHVRVSNAHYFGASYAKSASDAGVKVYLGVPKTTNRQKDDEEVEAVIKAVKDYPGTVEAVMVGDDLLGYDLSVEHILELVKQIKEGLGELAGTVKFGTSQDVNTYLRYADRAKKLDEELDIFGVQITPYYADRSNVRVFENPLSHVQGEWEKVKAVVPLSKMLLTKTSMPTDPANLEGATLYYTALRNWKPEGAENVLKFWYTAFDAWNGEPKTGFYDYNSKPKSTGGWGFPVKISDPEPPSPFVLDWCPSGIINIKTADSNSYAGRCEAEKCSPNLKWDSVPINVETPTYENGAQWHTWRLPNGKFALQPNTGSYLACCKDCAGDDEYPKQEFALVVNEVYPQYNPAAQWEVLELDNGNFAFRGDNGRYMARCNHCVRDGEANMLTAHADSSDEPYAQFELKCVCGKTPRISNPKC